MSLTCSGRYITRILRVYRGYSRPNLKQQIHRRLCNLSGTQGHGDPIDLLSNCGYLSYNESLATRVAKLQDVWKGINTTEVEVCKAYLKVCKENEMLVDHKEFIKSLKCMPDEELLVLLLEAVCSKGDVKAAMDLLSHMKDSGVAIDEQIFNALLLAHIIEGGLEHGQSVLRTMKTAHIGESENTTWMILKGLSQRKNHKEFLEVLKSTPKMQFNERKLFDVLITLGSNGNEKWIKDFLDFIGKDSIPKLTLSKISPICIQLIHRNCPDAAFLIYRLLVEVETNGNYGSNLLCEMINAHIPIETIIKLSKKLIVDEVNSQALVDVTENALRKGLVNESLALFHNLDVLRPHFFWPLLKIEGEESGEAGALNILEKMHALNVVPDHDTLEYYLLPYCDISSPMFLMKRINLKRKVILTPLISMLLKQGNIDDARDMSSNDILEASRLLKPLSDAWKKHKQSMKITDILQKICESSPVSADLTGEFLLKCLKTCKTGDDYNEFLKLAITVRKKRLTISSLSSEDISHVLKFYGKKCDCKNEIIEAMDNLIDIAKNESLHIKHPRDMNLGDLECHLLELSNKNMETRGVLRKLIQMHARDGNYKRIQELRELFKASDYEETAGMKASLLQTLVRAQEIDFALEVFKEIKNSHEDFEIDSFKIIDLVSLLLQTGGDIHEAIDILKIEAKENRTPGSLDRNCWKLLGHAKSPEEALKLLDCLKEYGYCKINNMILGPVLRAYLKQGDLGKAVEFYMKCAEQHKCTPLQLELFLTLIERQDVDLLNTVFETTAKVHGIYGTQVAFASALAEKGMQKPLAKFLIGMKRFRDDDLRKRCDKWIYERKMFSMKTLVLASKRLSPAPINLSIVHSSILKLYSKENDCQGALEYLKELEDNDIDIPNEFYRELKKMMIRCNYQVPKMLADKY